MNDKLENIPKWILKSEHDLIAAQQILLLETAPTDTVCYHAQQTVEKILKALLIQEGIEFSKTHNLLILLELLQDTDLDNYRVVCELLTSYAIESRYPGDYIEPEREEAEEAVRIASEIFELAKKKLGFK
jgi:HEPN domain-containing protein